jgi:hypothetical protein
MPSGLPAGRQAGLILSGTCIFPALKGRVFVLPNVSIIKIIISIGSLSDQNQAAI